MYDGMRPRVFVGLDLGAESSMVVLEDGEIVRNELGGHSSASIVGFNGRERYVGEAGVAQLSTNAANTVPVGQVVSGNRWLLAHRQVSSLAGGWIEVEYCGEKTRLSNSAAVAALVRKLGLLACAAANDKDLTFVAAVPPCWTPAQRATVADGLAAARVHTEKPRTLARSDACLCEVLAHKHPTSRTVAIVDVGRCNALVTVARFDGADFEILRTESSQELGTSALDALLYDHLVARVGFDVPPGSKKGARLLDAVGRLRKLLSTMKEAKVTCENLKEDGDVLLTATLDEFRGVCAPAAAAFRSLLEAAASASPVEAVELVGGGSRVAILREVVAEVFAGVEFGAKLDDSSVAHGAALAMARFDRVERTARVKAAVNGDDEATAEENDTVVAVASNFYDGGAVTSSTEALAAAEDAMCARDAELSRVAERRNAFETRILELRAAMNSHHHKDLFPENFASLLEEAEDALWSSGDDYVDLEEKRKTLEAACPAYFKKIQDERERHDRELEAAMRIDGEDDEDERREDKLNADTRKLKFSDRWRLVTKNKDEGTELFKDGNFAHATKRYKDALVHASKLAHDLTPDQQQQTKRVKIDLHVNMALCWQKLDKVEASVRSCDEALKLDEAHPKALYRRAFAYENLKRFDDAKRDVKRALEIAPQDRAILQLQKRVDAHLARQKKKEKAMWSRALNT
ncbi:hypothetical protein CTAYLR_005781 [Chrysophaeum taylorii]|uniref:Uncharacterized protein n=1 Tax=Chrysophaeum taylorii TaxID=2483200 RepID=A0AAD7ULM2_9STRA|nr:hypothetical protein CTAYLR_005781 [Chrysophaeum taylorii]